MLIVQGGLSDPNMPPEKRATQVEGMDRALKEFGFPDADVLMEECGTTTNGTYGALLDAVLVRAEIVAAVEEAEAPVRLGQERAALGALAEVYRAAQG
jgi:hypothetical protein